MSKPIKSGNPFRTMPSLTIDGKRAILAQAVAVLGEARLVAWLSAYNIHSIRQAHEQVRKYKAKFFRALFLLTQEVQQSQK